MIGYGESAMKGAEWHIRNKDVFILEMEVYSEYFSKKHKKEKCYCT